MNYYYILLGVALAILIILYRKELILRKQFEKENINFKKHESHMILAPFTEAYQYNAEDARFIGDPIHIIQFDNDKIVLGVFLEESGHLTSRQESIKKLIKDGYVSFEIWELKHL